MGAGGGAGGYLCDVVLRVLLVQVLHEEADLCKEHARELHHPPNLPAPLPQGRGERRKRGKTQTLSAKPAASGPAGPPIPPPRGTPPRTSPPLSRSPYSLSSPLPFRPSPALWQGAGLLSLSLSHAGRGGRR